MKKYAIIIGENNKELSREVQEALFEAGFTWRDGGTEAINTSALFISLNYCNNGSIGFDDRASVYIENKSKFLAPSDILNGGAMKLDGAKVVEPRYFLDTLDTKKVHTTGKKGHLQINIDGSTRESRGHCNWNLEGMLRESERFSEITKADLDDYILKYAEKAKELGMTLGIPLIGYHEILCFEDGSLHTPSYTYGKEVAGYRYCRKVDTGEEYRKARDHFIQKVVQPAMCGFMAMTPDAPYGFCHKCGKEVDPKDSNFCSKCGTELIKEK